MFKKYNIGFYSGRNNEKHANCYDNSTESLMSYIAMNNERKFSKEDWLHAYEMALRIDYNNIKSISEKEENIKNTSIKIRNIIYISVGIFIILIAPKISVFIKDKYNLHIESTEDLFDIIFALFALAGIVADKISRDIFKNKLDDLVSVSSINNFVAMEAEKNGVYIKRYLLLNSKNNTNSEILNGLNCNYPENFICPITHDIMDIPIYFLNNKGHFDKKAIEKWMIKALRHPLTNRKINLNEMRVDHKLQSEISEYVISNIMKYVKNENQDIENQTENYGVEYFW